MPRLSDSLYQVFGTDVEHAHLRVERETEPTVPDSPPTFSLLFVRTADVSHLGDGTIRYRTDGQTVTSLTRPEAVALRDLLTEALDFDGRPSANLPCPVCGTACDAAARPADAP